MGECSEEDFGRKCEDLGQGRCACVVGRLLTGKQFTEHSQEVMKRILSESNLKPSMDGLVLKKFMRTFSNKNDCMDWLCGCKTTGKLHCWPCLLYSRVHVPAWSKNAFNYLTYFNKSKASHETSEVHLRSCLKLAAFKCAELKRSKEEVILPVLEKHAKTIEAMIQATAFLVEQGVEPMGKIKVAAEFSGVVRDLSETPLEEGELLEGMAEALVARIGKEAAAAPYLSVIVDEMGDSWGKSRMAITIRYISMEGSVVERFLGFQNLTGIRFPAVIAARVNAVLQGLQAKVVGQSYDGGVVKASDFETVVNAVTEVHEEAILLPCYAHSLHSILSNSLGFIKECKKFFLTLSSFCDFFTQAHSRGYEEQVRKWFPEVKVWTQKTVLAVAHDSGQNLQSFLENIIGDSQVWGKETQVVARGLRESLRDFDFKFLVILFSRIFPKTHSFFQKLNKNFSDLRYCSDRIAEFKAHLESLKDNFDQMWCSVTGQEPPTCPPPPKKIKKEVLENDVVDEKEAYRRFFLEILEVIQANMTNRFYLVTNLNFLLLLDPKHYSNFLFRFPHLEMIPLEQLYGDHFDMHRLKHELSAMYKCHELKNLRVQALYRFLKSSGTDKIFPEVTKLAALIISLPVAPPVNGLPSSLQRIRSYLGHPGFVDRTDTAILHIEKKMLATLKEDPGFKEQVIRRISQKKQILT